MTSDWIYCGTVRVGGFVFNDPLCVGQFEFTRKDEPLKVSDDALAKSAQAWGLVVGADVVKAKCLFQEAEADDVEAVGRLWLRESVEMLGLALPGAWGGRFEVVGAGFLLDLSTGGARPVLPQKVQKYSKGLIAVRNRNVADESMVAVGSILTAPPEQVGELGRALRRSTHWAAMARRAEDWSDELLLRWIACETLTRVSENESLTAKLVSALGFPTGRYAATLPARIRAMFSVDPRVVAWTKKLKKLFDDVREARNGVAHSGYRELEALESLGKGDLAVARLALTLLVPRLQGLGLAAFRLGMRSVEELWDGFGRVLIEARRESPCVSTDTVENVMYMLDRA